MSVKNITSDDRLPHCAVFLASDHLHIPCKSLRSQISILPYQVLVRHYMDFKFCYHPPCAARRLSNSQSQRKITFITESGLNAFGMAVPHPVLARLPVDLDHNSCSPRVGQQRRFVKFWPHEKKPQSKWHILFVDAYWRCYCPWADDLVWSGRIDGPDNFS